MAEVEAQPIRRHQRARLLNLCTQYVAQGPVKEVRTRVVPNGCGAPFGVDTQCRRITLALALSAGPAAVLILPVLANSYRNTGHLQLTYQGSLVLYHRAVAVEGFDSSQSPAMTELREAFEEGRSKGIVRPTETMRDIFRSPTLIVSSTVGRGRIPRE